MATVKKGFSKSELVPSNGKSKLLRGAKGHFAGSVAIKKEIGVVGENINESDYTKTLPATYPHARTGHLMIYRVYSKNVGQGSGYYFTIKQDSLSDTSLESVMTLYNPKTDILALERAIRKYKMDIDS